MVMMSWWHLSSHVAWLKKTYFLLLSVAGTRFWEQPEIQRRQVHHRAGSHDQRQRLGVTVARFLSAQWPTSWTLPSDTAHVHAHKRENAQTCKQTRLRTHRTVYLDTSRHLYRVVVKLEGRADGDVYGHYETLWDLFLRCTCQHFGIQKRFSVDLSVFPPPGFGVLSPRVTATRKAVDGIQTTPSHFFLSLTSSLWISGEPWGVRVLQTLMLLVSIIRLFRGSNRHDWHDRLFGGLGYVVASRVGEGGLRGVAVAWKFVFMTSLCFLSLFLPWMTSLCNSWDTLVQR